jgi:phage baseplate assembly protein W
MVSYNIKFPLNDDVSVNSYFALTKTTKDALTSDLLLLLLTQKGERYYEPEYGTDLLRFIFEPNDNLVQADVEQEIKKTVSSYIPALKIDQITFNKDVDEQGLPMKETQLNVNIKFTYSEDTFSEVGELELNF